MGAGNVARTLAPWLHAAGYGVDEIIARPASLARARGLARRAGAIAGVLEEARLDADIVWLCVPDDSIAVCARELAVARENWRGQTVLHCSGALTSGELAPLRRRGASVGSVHPMMTFVNRVRLDSAKGIPFAVEGDPAAIRVAHKIVRDLGGEIVPLHAKHKPLYHALGAFASPLIIAELAVAEQIARAAGIPVAKARRTIGPILMQTLRNYLQAGAAKSFSGPLLRGDLGTIQKHLKVLRALPGARQAYVALARTALRNLPVGNRKEMKRLLKG